MGKIRLNKNILKKMKEGTYGLVSVKQGLLGDQYFDTGAKKYQEVWEFLLNHFNWDENNEIINNDNDKQVINCLYCKFTNKCKNTKLPKCFAKKDME